MEIFYMTCCLDIQQLIQMSSFICSSIPLTTDFSKDMKQGLLIEYGSCFPSVQVYVVERNVQSLCLKRLDWVCLRMLTNLN